MIRKNMLTTEQLKTRRVAAKIAWIIDFHNEVGITPNTMKYMVVNEMHLAKRITKNSAAKCRVDIERVSDLMIKKGHIYKKRKFAISV